MGEIRSWLEATPEGREALRRAEHCRSCGAHVHGREGSRLCTARACTIWFCPDCGEVRGQVGPMGCAACNPPRWWERLALGALRLLTRRKP